MSDTPNASPAGESGQTPAPTGPMDRDTAVSLLSGLDNEPEQAVEAAPDAVAQTTVDDASEAAPEADAEAGTEDEEGAESAPGDDDEAEVAAADDAEEQIEPEEKIHGNTRTRLRDGTEITVGELKKGYDELKEYRAKVPQIAVQEKQLSDLAAQLAQREQFVQQVSSQAMEILQVYIPPPPDPSLLQTDPIGHYEQQIRHQGAINQLRQLQEAQAAHQAQIDQQARAAAEAARQERLVAGHKDLLVRIPEFADPEKAKAISQNFYDTVTEFGFTKADIEGVDDPRILHLVHALSKKAAAYDKLMAQKAVVQAKVKAAPAVQKPGARVPPDVAAQRELDGQIKQWRDSGRSREGAAKLLSTV